MSAFPNLDEWSVHISHDPLNNVQPVSGQITADIPQALNDDTVNTAANPFSVFSELSNHSSDVSIPMSPGVSVLNVRF